MPTLHWLIRGGRFWFASGMKPPGWPPTVPATGKRLGSVTGQTGATMEPGVWIFTYGLMPARG